MKDEELDEQLEIIGKELKRRSTAEVTNGVVNQVTQALDEQPNKVKFMIFGELQERNIIPIDEACAKCDHCYFKTVKQCQDRQSQDAKARGFNSLICPQQFVD